MNIETFKKRYPDCTQTLLDKHEFDDYVCSDKVDVVKLELKRGNFTLCGDPKSIYKNLRIKDQYKIREIIVGCTFHEISRIYMQHAQILREIYGLVDVDIVPLNILISNGIRARDSFTNVYITTILHPQYRDDIIEATIEKHELIDNNLNNKAISFLNIGFTGEEHVTADGIYLLPLNHPILYLVIENKGFTKLDLFFNDIQLKIDYIFDSTKKYVIIPLFQIFVDEVANFSRIDVIKLHIDNKDHFEYFSIHKNGIKLQNGMMYKILND